MTITAATPVKSIEYDRESHDYKLTLDGQFIGYARSYVDGEATLDRIILDRLCDERAYAIERQMLALSTAYQEARAAGRMDEAKQIKAQAKALETAHPGVAYEVLEGQKAA